MPIYWYFCPPGAADIPETIFGNPTLDPLPRGKSLGCTHKFAPGFLGNFKGTTGKAPCGDATAWTQGVSINNLAPCNCPNCMCVPQQEIPGGTVDGNNRAFTLSKMPLSAMSVMLFVGGLLQTQGVNYSIAGQNIYFDGGSTPTVGSNLVAWYIVQT